MSSLKFVDVSLLLLTCDQIKTSLEFLQGIERGHFNRFVFVCGYKLFQTFWFELWIMDYFVSVLYNPQIEFKKKRKMSRSFTLNLQSIRLMAAFSSHGLRCLGWKCVLCLYGLTFRDRFLKKLILAFGLVGNEDPSFVVIRPTSKHFSVWAPTVEEA